MTKADEDRLLQRVTDEAIAARKQGFHLPIHLDLNTLTGIVGQLQLALRHPANGGPVTKMARELIDGIIARVDTAGYQATAELMRLGDNPENDHPI